MAVVVLALATLIIASNLLKSDGSTATVPNTTYSPVTQAPPPAPTSRTVTTTYSSSPQVDPETRARAQLRELSTRHSLTTDGHYLVELSAKFVGCYDPQLTAQNGTHTFYATDIVAEHLELANRFGPDVHMFDSRTFGKQTVNRNKPPTEEIWVTVYDPGTFPTKASVASWCTANFPGLSGDALDNVCLTRMATPPH